MKRCDILQYAVENPLCIELGVAQGEFSEMILKYRQIDHLYSVDRWAGDRRHDDLEYNNTVKRLAPYSSKNTILRMTFEEALNEFPDEHFDFIYADGYAHTGQDDGKTLYDWWPKLKVGGVFAGDDYSPRWTKNVEIIDKFLADKKHTMQVFDFDEGKSGWSANPSWFTIKTRTNNE